MSPSFSLLLLSVLFFFLIIFYLCRYLLINFFLKVIFFFLSNAEVIAICSLSLFLSYLFPFSFFFPIVFQHFALFSENSFSAFMFPFCGSLCSLPLYPTTLSFLPYLLYYQDSHITPFHSHRNYDYCLLSDTLSFLGSLFFSKHVKLSPRHYCFVPEPTHNCKLPFHQIYSCSDSCTFCCCLEIEKGIKCPVCCYFNSRIPEPG